MAQRLVRAKRKIRDARDPVPRPARPPPARPPRAGARGPLPRLQRGLLRDGRRRARPPRALRRGDPAREAARGPDARRAGGARPARADAPPRLAARGPRRRATASSSCSRTRTARAGTASGSTRALRVLDRALRARPAGAVPAAGGDRRASTRTRRAPDDTDWPQIAALYARLAELAPSPVVELNRAVAVAMARGRRRGSTLVDRIEGLERLPPPPRGARRLLRRLGRREEAADAYRRALELATNPIERALPRAAAARSRLTRHDVGVPA